MYYTLSNGREIPIAEGKNKLYNINCNKFVNAHFTKCCSVFTLVSYTTPVCTVVIDGVLRMVKVFERIGYGDMCDSHTTMKHVNAFRKIFGLGRVSKKEWNNM